MAATSLVVSLPSTPSAANSTPQFGQYCSRTALAHPMGVQLKAGCKQLPQRADDSRCQMLICGLNFCKARQRRASCQCPDSAYVSQWLQQSLVARIETRREWGVHMFSVCPQSALPRGLSPDDRMAICLSFPASGWDPSRRARSETGTDTPLRDDERAISLGPSLISPALRLYQALGPIHSFPLQVLQLLAKHKSSRNGSCSFLIQAHPPIPNRRARPQTTTIGVITLPFVSRKGGSEPDAGYEMALSASTCLPHLCHRRILYRLRSYNVESAQITVSAWLPSADIL